jgi:hypothetical protein
MLMDERDDQEVRRELIEFGAPDDRGRRRWRMPLVLHRWADRGGAWGRQAERSRWLVIGAVVASVTALNVAFVGWATRGSVEAVPAQVSQRQTHGLTEDQAACFAFSRVELRFSTLVIASGEDFVGPRSDALAAEVNQLDQLGTDYPGADYRLIVAFHEIGDASIRLAAAINTIQGRDLLSQRSGLLSAAYDACADLARFDARSGTPLT